MFHHLATRVTSTFSQTGCCFSHFLVAQDAAAKKKLRQREGKNDDESIETEIIKMNFKRSIMHWQVKRRTCVT